MVARVLLVAVLAVHSALAGEWIKVTSPHFELYTTAGEKRAREAVTFFEQVRDFFLRLTSGTRVDRGRVRIVAFSSAKEYKPFSPGEQFAAYYLDSGDRDYIVMGSLGADSGAIAVHEYTHLWLRDAAPQLSGWLNEGLAELHSTLKPERGKVALGHAIPSHLRTIREGKWIPLPRLLEVNAQSPEYNEKDRTGMFYAQSWALAHMLYFDPAYRPRFTDFLRASFTLRSSLKAFAEVYRKPLAQVEEDLRFYVRGDRFYSVQFDVKLQQLAEAPLAAPATELETGLLLAEIAGLMRRTDTAQELYDELAGKHAGAWEIEASRARTAWVNRDSAGAKRHYERAVELRSTDARLHLEFAKLVQAEDAGKAVHALRRALQLEASLKEARFLLGYLLYQQRNWTGAVEQFVAMKEITPDQAFPLFSMLAHAQYETGDRASAKLNAERARKYAKTPEEIRSADDLMRAVAPRIARFVEQTPPPPDVPPPPQDESPSETPQAPPARSAAEQMFPGEKLERVEGRFTSLDCAGRNARVHITAGTRKLVLLIQDPGRIVIETPGGAGTLDFTCGPQKARRTVVEFLPKPDAKLGLSGFLRGLRFLE